MSDAAGVSRVHVESIAISRGIHLARGRAAEIASQTSAILRRFRTLSGGLTTDDDPYEYRRLMSQLSREAQYD